MGVTEIVISDPKQAFDPTDSTYFLFKKLFASLKIKYAFSIFFSALSEVEENVSNVESAFFKISVAFVFFAKLNIFEEVLYFQLLIPPKRLKIFPP